jgi:hypothetical protein
MPHLNLTGFVRRRNQFNPGLTIGNQKRRLKWNRCDSFYERATRVYERVFRQPTTSKYCLYERRGSGKIESQFVKLASKLLPTCSTLDTYD